MEQHELELATQFYGLNLTVDTASGKNAARVLHLVQQNATIAVAIEANALAAVNQNALLRALHRRFGAGVPLLILGVTTETDTTLLNTWSGGAAVGAKRLPGPLHLQYVVGRVAGITEQLTAREIPFPGDDTTYFVLAEHSRAQEIMAVRNDRQIVPVFIEADLHQQKVFLLCKVRSPLEGAVKRSADSMVNAFAEIAPVMMFAKYSAGERGWHAIHHYANLTIDDPWLREPYGYLSYKGLLKEMEKHDFHTTIAFIPWNYDRSEAETISLFRSHPERFSICVHGDNHDHKEFEDLGSKPLSVQIAALKQSLARMEKFKILTGIPYDNVVVFPHSIGTESILEGLKNYNFLATINSSNVPMDRSRPSGVFFALRPVTLSFANFPSIIRYPAAMPSPSAFLGINAFLDNPLFLYSHHDFFANGMDAFDGMADEVNKLEPNTRWRSIGEIVNHLYLVRLRDDSNYDVLTFSSSIDLENTSGRDLVFHVRKQESGSPVIASVGVDGRHVPFQLREGYLDLSVPVPAGKARSIMIQYKNDLDLASISTSKSSFRVYLLRKVSDYRDLTLSKYYVGRAINDYYYKHELTPRLLVLCGCTLVLFSISGSWGLWVIRKRKNSVAVGPDILPSDKIAREASDGCTRFWCTGTMHLEDCVLVGQASDYLGAEKKMAQYVIITPIRDEERFIEATVASIQGQTIRPAEWVVVDDGSTDRTGEIIDRHAAQLPWIRVVHRVNRGFRKSGGGVMEAFYDGYRALRCEGWDFIVKLDGDLTLPPDYFEKCFEHFERDPELGVGGGDIYHDIGGVQKLEATPKFHVRGATKIYRRACWEAIGGLWQAPGWDTIDEVKANMLGWKTYSFSELQIVHHRLTGTAEGLLRDKIKRGIACYVSGYHPLFLVASCVSNLVRKPYVTGSAAIFYGFLKGHWIRMPRVNDQQLIKYLRTQQLRRLCGLNTIWK